MKSVFKNLSLFVCLVIAISALGSCSGSSSSSNTATEQSNTSVNAGTAPREKTEEEKKNSPNYRPIEKAVDDADLKNLDGSTFKIADKRGKVLLLNMWATWCGPCRSEMPTLVKMQDQHRDKGLEIIGLDTDDETVEDINKFAADMKLNYTLVWADSNLQAALLKISKFGGIPQSFIIDRDGNLRGVFRGANPADVKKMEELIGMIVQE